MCLIENCADKKDFIKQSKKKRITKFTFWKVVKICNNNYYSTMFSCLYKPGWNKSDRKHVLNDPFDRGWYIHRGIHVYLTRHKARFNVFCNDCKVIKVICYLKDFVSCNNKDQEAVFMKVFVPKKELK